MSNGIKIRSEFNKHGNVLISDQFNNRVIETTPRGEIVWSFGLGPNDFTFNSIIGVNDAQRIGSLTLMAGTGTPQGVLPPPNDGQHVDNRVIIVDKHGKIIWQYGQFGVTGSGPNQLNAPVQSTFVPHHWGHESHVSKGTVLITDQGNNRIIEVSIRTKQIVWQFPADLTSSVLNSPNSAERLHNGHTLIADENNNRAIEVNRRGEIVKTFTAGGTLGACAFASRLPNRNTLLTDTGNSRIVEVDSHDNIVWQYIIIADFNSVSTPLPTRGIRLKNGDTIISDQTDNRVIIVNQTTNVKEIYGLPSGIVGNVPSLPPDGFNAGFDLHTTQLGLFGPYDAKIIGDYTGLTPV